MNYLDIIIVLPVCWGVIKGLKNGLVLEAASLAALALGIAGAIRFSNITAGWINAPGQINESYVPIIAFAVTFIAIVIVTHLFAKILDKLVKSIALGLVNRAAGAAFGALKFGCIVSVFALVIDKLDSRLHFLSPSLVNDSMLYRHTVNLASYLYSSLPF
jgi:membrane protein required for colicin V production